MLPFFMTNNGAMPNILNEFSGLYRPTATDADLDRAFRTGVAIYVASTIRKDNMGLVNWRVVDQNNRELDIANPFYTAFKHGLADIIRRSELSLCFRGRALLYKRHNSVTGRFAGLQHINFNIYMLDKYPDRGLVGFRITSHQADMEPIDVGYLPLEEAVYWHLEDLVDDFDGVSPAEVTYMNAGVDTEIATMQLALFQNMAIPPLLVMPDENSSNKPTEEERNQFADLLRRVAKGVMNAGRTVISPNRWDVKELNLPYDKLAMPDLSKQAKEAVYAGFRVPIELVMPSASNYAQAFEAKRQWVETWLVPHAHWYAEQFTDQLVRPIDPHYRVEPDFARVPGAKDDIVRRTEYVNAQVSGGYRDLYTAAEMTENNPDPRLRGLYVVGGKPTPIGDMSKVWEMSATQGSSVSAPGLPNLHLSPSSTVPMRPIKALLEPGPDGWLPDTVYKEIRDWERIINRKGRGYDFQARVLPSETVTMGKSLLSAGYDIPETFKAIKAHYVAYTKSAENPAYISLQLSDTAGNLIKQLCDELDLGDVTDWQKPETYHLSLCYVNHITANQLADAVKQFPSEVNIPLKAIGLHSFEDTGNGYPVHLVIDKTPELLDLQRVIYDALADRDTSEFSDPDNFNPHITLCYTSSAPMLPMLTNELDLTVDGLYVGRDDYQTIHVIPAGEKAMSAATGASGGVVLNQDEAKKKLTPNHPISVDAPAEFHDYWADYDKLMANIGTVWLNDYMSKVWAVIEPRIRNGFDAGEIRPVLSRYSQDLLNDWLGTIEKPGIVLALILAGMGAGNTALLNGSKANPHHPIAAKSLSVPVDWTLLNREAYSFAKQYLPQLIKRVNQTTLEATRDANANWMSSGQPLAELKKALFAIYNDQIRADNIAETETTRAYVEGALQRYRIANVQRVKLASLRDKLVCDICKPLEGTTVSIRDGWTSKLGNKFPPFHPRCRHWVIPDLS